MRTLATLAAALTLTAGLAGTALADQPGADWIPKDQLIQKLEADGYSNIKELEADDGHWEGEGLKNGVAMEFHADPKTGALISEKPEKDGKGDKDEKDDD